ncbi:hypothetical protein [Rhodoferax sp.]|uniref:hypothetical protein n=1 Tax=Rhodoferax sp. TaxID=50421 RepID=UPI00374D4768
MRQELIQPTTTILAALIATEADRLSSGHRISCQDLFVTTYRKLEAALEQIEQEDSGQRPHTELRRA